MATAVLLGRGQVKREKWFPIQTLTKLARPGRVARSSLIPSHCPGNWQPGKSILWPCMFLWKKLEYAIPRGSNLEHCPSCSPGPYCWVIYSQTASEFKLCQYEGIDKHQDTLMGQKEDKNLFYRNELVSHYYIAPYPWERRNNNFY